MPKKPKNKVKDEPMSEKEPEIVADVDAVPDTAETTPGPAVEPEVELSPVAEPAPAVTPKELSSGITVISAFGKSIHIQLPNVN